MSNTLTVKQKKFVANIIAGQNGTLAANGAYKPKNANTAGVIAYENLRKPKIQAELSKVLDQCDLFETSVRSLADAMKATKHCAALNHSLPDHRIRLDAAKIGMNLWFWAHGYKPFL